MHTKSRISKQSITILLLSLFPFLNITATCEAASSSMPNKVEAIASEDSVLQEKEAARILKCLDLTTEDAVCTQVTKGYLKCIMDEAGKRGIDCHDMLTIVENNLKLLKARLKQLKAEEAEEAKQRERLKEVNQ